MDSLDRRIQIDSYVSKYMDENGCSFKQACEDLEIDMEDVFKLQYDDEEW
ncbi:hypothetical protein [Clostridium tarantellae]|nr:hypothetical protein [Clostridium tarantellae]